MCTDTFLHLPEEKRNRFLEAAWEEFVHSSFSDASINQIVQRAGIPRGSFYQYFSGKEELFYYLMSDAWKYCMRRYREVVSHSNGDLFLAQELCFEQFVQENGTPQELSFSRSVQVVRKNSGMLLQLLMEQRPGKKILAEVEDLLDFRLFKKQDREYIENVFLMTLLALAAAVTSGLSDPDRMEDHRRLLILRLHIIKNGSLEQSVAKQA